MPRRAGTGTPPLSLIRRIPPDWQKPCEWTDPRLDASYSKLEIDSSRGNRTPLTCRLSRRALLGVNNRYRGGSSLLSTNPWSKNTCRCLELVARCGPGVPRCVSRTICWSEAAAGRWDPTGRSRISRKAAIVTPGSTTSDRVSEQRRPVVEFWICRATKPLPRFAPYCFCSAAVPNAKPPKAWSCTFRRKSRQRLRRRRRPLRSRRFW